MVVVPPEGNPTVENPTVENPTVEVQKAVSWSYDGTQVVLYPTPERTFRLVVMNPKDYVVVYRTAINTSKPVAKVLEPLKGSTKDFRVYEFTHRFSRTTVWMAVVFRKDGRRVDELTRTFYGDISKPVPGKDYLDRGEKGKPRPIKIEGDIKIRSKIKAPLEKKD